MSTVLTSINPRAKLEGEDSPEKEAAKLFENPDEWLSHPHPLLGGRTPRDCVKQGDEYAVRNLLRQIRFVGQS